MTKYYQDKYKFNKDTDVPISVRNYEYDNSNETYYCNYCQRNLIKLIDSSHQNVSYYCQNCSISVNPEESNLRSKSKVSMSEGPPDKPLATTKFVEPTVGRKSKEIKGGLAELQKRGMKIKNYTESKG